MRTPAFDPILTKPTHSACASNDLRMRETEDRIWMPAPCSPAVSDTFKVRSAGKPILERLCCNIGGADPAPANLDPHPPSSGGPLA